MRHYFLTCAILFLFVGSTFAQSKETRFQQIEAAKIAYITKNLELTPAEAQKFFPIYNEYHKEIRNIMHESRTGRSNFNQDRGLEFDAKILACKKKYRTRFTTVISGTKASRFFEVEREFRAQLFKELESRNRKKR